MSNLTSKEIEEKIERVNVDLKLLMSTGDASRRTEVLSEYKALLEDELAEAKRAGR
jgi:hypothetical protein